MNKMELVEHIAGETELSKAAAAAALDAVVEGITKALRKGDEVRLVGFGTFSVRERAAGKGRNPATGAPIKIPASKNARFKAGATLKASLNKNAKSNEPAAPQRRYWVEDVADTRKPRPCDRGSRQSRSGPLSGRSAKTGAA
jgi:DNA-binding protein HU-beta